MPDCGGKVGLGAGVHLLNGPLAEKWWGGFRNFFGIFSLKKISAIFQVIFFFIVGGRAKKRVLKKKILSLTRVFFFNPFFAPNHPIFFKG